MKLPDSAQLGAEDFYVLSDPWRQEWEKGVQVPANMDAVPDPVVRYVSVELSVNFTHRKNANTRTATPFI